MLRLTALLCCMAPLFLLAEGGKNLTPANTGVANGVNQFVGYLQNGDANNSLSFLAHPGEPGFNTSHRLLIRVKPGEVVYYGIQRIDASGTLANNDTVIINLRRTSDGVIVKADTLTSSAVPAGTLNAHSGVISSYASMVAGPAAIVGASGYNAIAYTYPLSSSAETDLVVEILDDGATASLRASLERDWYSLWDFSVYSGTTEKKGRLHAKYWSFNAASGSNRLSSTFQFFSAIPNYIGNKYYIKSINLSGMQPFGFFFTANETGTLKDANGNATSNYSLRRKSRNFYTGVYSDGYTQFENFVNDPDTEFWPSAIISNPIIRPTSLCNTSRANGGAMQINYSVTTPGVAIILIDLNNIDGYQPGTKDVLFETSISIPGDTTIVWDGLDGTGANVPSGTAFKVTYRFGSFPVHFPIYDAENNSDGFALFDERPFPTLTPAIAFWDDSAIVAGSAQIFGVTSNGAVHPWGGTGTGILANNIGDTKLFNTWIYGQLREFKNTYLHVYNCNGLPPVANNYINNPIPQTNGATLIPSLVATDPDGTIATYTIATIPLATEGVLTYCSNGTEPCTGTITTITVNTVLTPVQMLSLKFSPTKTFAGIAQFTFTATDNTGNSSNVATYQLPVVANPPIANNIVNTSMHTASGPTSISNLSASDADGNIASYVISTIPLASEGVLSYCSNGTEPCTGIVTTITAGTSLSPTQMATLKFDPTGGFIGNAVFTYTAIDNSGNVSNNATFTIPVTPTSTIQFPPLVDNIMAQPINNNSTAIAIPKLQATDLDGTVVNYTILSVPNVASGVLYYCPTAPIACSQLQLVAVTVGMQLTPAQGASLQFDPFPNYVGTATFLYTATDNKGNIGNMANYSIPIVNTPPTVSNITTTVPFNANATSIPNLSGIDGDGTISFYTVQTIPNSAEGVLMYCPTAPISCNIAALLPVTAGQQLTTAQASTIYFDPANNFSGTANFTFSAQDNNANNSSIANYTITVANQPPVAQNITLPTIANTAGATAIAPLIAADVDGTISTYTIQTIPAATEGTLKLCTPACIAITPGQVLTAAQISQLTFTPNNTFTGVASFTYTATDNSSNPSNLAFYYIPVSGSGNIPPISNQIIAPLVNSNAGAAAIPALQSTDVDGTIALYTIEILPSTVCGQLLLNGVPVTLGQTLTALQMTQLQFDPAANFTGNAIFEYTATDNGGLKSNNATYTIPVTNNPPIANAIVANTMPNTNSATSIPALVASDVDGNVVSYTITSIPALSQGILLLSGVPITIGQVLTTLQISQLQFDPTFGYSGNVLFDYFATDNNNLISNIATYTLNITGLPPISQNVVSPVILNASGATTIPALISTDADGTIANYIINSIPPASQGILLLNGVPITVHQSLTPAQISQLQFDPNANFTGIALFNYSAFDNYSNISNNATYVIPITSATVLPVTLVSFNAALIANKTNIDWSTTNEINCSKFEVEKSNDGIHFTLLENIEAVHTSAILKKYSIVDNYLMVGNNYYRLKIFDVDRRFTYSNIKWVYFTNKKSITVWPNPVSDKLNITINLPQNSIVHICVYDILGNIILSKKQPVVKGANQLVVAGFTTLLPGNYVVKIIDEISAVTQIVHLIK
jgi:Bacterial Ig domain/Secretion system C-terminal sorting domain